MLFLHAFNKKNRSLLRELVITDFKLRYQGSVLGYLWSLLKPLMLFVIMYVVFGVWLKFGSGIDHFPLYLLLGVVLWGFFMEATNNGLGSIVGRGDLIRKINFPKYIIVISGTISALINLAFNLVIVGIFMVVAGVDVGERILWLPLLMLELYVFALALAFFLSAAFVKYRDISYVWEVGMQAAFYATPILYPLSMVMKESELAAKLVLLNPVAQIIQDARYAAITTQTQTAHTISSNPWLYIVPLLIVTLSVVLAVLYFRANAKYFAEYV